MKHFSDYKAEAPNWITMADGEFYPDILSDACELYRPVLVLFGGYPNDNRPVDFIIRNSAGAIKAIGLARYDGDRGGAQEDDRTGGYANCAKEILGYAKANGLDLKIIFINDGPGLLLGSMWDDYSKIEAIDYDHIRVVTLRMVNERINNNWLK